MRYIKKFNESSDLNNEDMSDIKDVLQEYIDEYDLVNGETITDDFRGIAYDIWNSSGRINLRIELYYNGNLEKMPIINEIDSKFNDDFIPRLKNMGYNVSYNKKDLRISGRGYMIRLDLLIMQ